MQCGAQFVPMLAVAMEAHALVRLRVRPLGRAPAEWITAYVRIFEPPDHPFGVILEHRDDDGTRQQSTVLLAAIESMEIVDR